MVGKRDSLRNLMADIEDGSGCSSNELEEEGIEATSFYLVSPTEAIALERLQTQSSYTLDEEEGENASDDSNSYNSDEYPVACNLQQDGQTWKCQPYRREMISGEILRANRRGDKQSSAILKLLNKSGIRVYVVDASVSSTITEIMKSIRSCIKHASKHQHKSTNGTNDHQRCLLYKDKRGRFYNLVLAEYTTAPEHNFKEYLTSFSGIQAMSVLTVLCRSFACATESEIVEQDFRPAYLGLLLGLVFVEEISFSWINTAMFVRGVPSISAYSITTHVETDWLRKILVFTLAISATTTGKTQFVLTFFGISLACAVLLANLGSRAWTFLNWKPIAGKGGIFEPIIAYIAAIIVGLTIPYMGHREVSAGGKAAMESVLRSAVIVAVVFLISDYDEFQKFLVIGSENCNQDIVNISVGIWWSLSLLLSLVLVLKIPQPSILPDDQQPLLQADSASPVGYRLPSVPDFPIDPILEQKGISFLNLKVEFVFGALLAFGIGTGIVFLAFTEFDEDLASNSLQVDPTNEGFFSLLRNND